MTIVETTEIDGFNVQIWVDEEPMNPRQEFEPITTMTCWHRRYALGDDHKYSDLNALLRSLAGIEDENTEYSITDLLNKVREKDYEIKLLSLYDHSGITISTSGEYPFNDRFDSMLVGVIYVDKQSVIEHTGSTEDNWREQAIKEIDSDVDVYDAYIRGDVYGFTVEKDGEEFDSCGGFYGSDHAHSNLMETAAGMVQSAIIEVTERAEAVYSYNSSLENFIEDSYVGGTAGVIVTDKNGQLVGVFNDETIVQKLKEEYLCTSVEAILFL